jgi:hypothetical protein
LNEDKDEDSAGVGEMIQFGRGRKRMSLSKHKAKNMLYHGGFGLEEKKVWRWS